MNLNNFTIKAAEVVQQAQQLAFNNKNPNIETEHILKALLDMEDSPIEYLLKKNNVTINLVENKLSELVKKLPTSTTDSIYTIYWICCVYTILHIIHPDSFNIKTRIIKISTWTIYVVNINSLLSSLSNEIFRYKYIKRIILVFLPNGNSCYE